MAILLLQIFERRDGDGVEEQPRVSRNPDDLGLDFAWRWPLEHSSPWTQMIEIVTARILWVGAYSINHFLCNYDHLAPINIILPSSVEIHVQNFAIINLRFHKVLWRRFHNVLSANRKPLNSSKVGHNSFFEKNQPR